MLKILIADDHAIVRRGMVQILEEAGVPVQVDEAANGNEAISRVRDNQYDIILLDISMPGKSGVDVLKQIKSEFPKLPVLILSMYPEEQYAVRLIKAGASGYITKESAPELLSEAVTKVSSGQKFISPSVANLLAESINSDVNEIDENKQHLQLSDREYHVFLEIASGKSQTDIAKELSLSVKTIASYRSRIMQKMHMNSNADMTLYASRNSLI